MNYYIDTEFLEGKQKESLPISLFRKNTPNTIDLISIGIVSEDGREYYAISKDFNLKEAWNRFDLVDDYDVNGDLVKNVKKVYWIRENVLKPIWEDLIMQHNHKVSRLGLTINHKDVNKFNYKELKKLLNAYGKTNKQIAEEIKEFCLFKMADANKRIKFKMPVTPVFYAYFADYDWVVFCWLFGRMIDLPNGFPNHCIDLKQELDRKVFDLKWFYGRDIWSNLKRSIQTIGKGELQEEDRVATFDEKLKVLKELEEYPKQTNEHNALADAKWNKELHEFILKL